MKQRLMELYFTAGADLSDPQVLAEAAGECGLDADETRRRLASEEDADAVATEAKAAAEAGIDGVPHFILAGVVRIAGAQPAEHLAQALAHAAGAGVAEAAPLAPR